MTEGIWKIGMGGGNWLGIERFFSSSFTIFSSNVEFTTAGFS